MGTQADNQAVRVVDPAAALLGPPLPLLCGAPPATTSATTTSPRVSSTLLPRHCPRGSDLARSGRHWRRFPHGHPVGGAGAHRPYLIAPQCSHEGLQISSRIYTLLVYSGQPRLSNDVQEVAMAGHCMKLTHRSTTRPGSGAAFRVPVSISKALNMASGKGGRGRAGPRKGPGGAEWRR